jgi:hypothetical protein
MRAAYHVHQHGSSMTILSEPRMQLSLHLSLRILRRYYAELTINDLELFFVTHFVTDFLRHHRLALGEGRANT